MLKRFVPVVALLAMAAGAEGQARAGVVMEMGNAGRTRATAQVADPSDGVVDTILGSLSNNDDVDAYQILVTGGTLTARTFYDNISYVSDPMLHLFDATGSRIFRADDGGGGPFDLQSQFTISGLASGIYYLAISSYSNDPLGNGNLDNGWQDNGGSRGNYRIELTGASSVASVPEPTTLASSAVGLALLGLGYSRRRRARA